MKAWTAPVPFGPRAKTKLLGDLGESVPRRPLCKPATAFGKEERRSGWCSENPPSRRGIRFQSVYSGWMNRHIPRLSKLRPPYMKNSAIQVHVLPVETEGFVHAHPGHRE